MYKPSRKNRNILEAAYAHIKNVPYKVSLRWVFYRLLQDGFYSDKEDYKKWKALASVARKRFYSHWAPDTLADDTRDIIFNAGGYPDEHVLREKYFLDVLENYPPELDHFILQDEYVIICFEARAMADQFMYYTKRINLVPFGGDPSIPLKWKIAKHIEQSNWYYEMPVRILYFGDYDSKGWQIVRSALTDVSEWCKVCFYVEHCGLSLEQAKKYKIPENPEKPGEFQWEALDDNGASEIIMNAVLKYVDIDKLDYIKNVESSIMVELQDKVRSI